MGAGRSIQLPSTTVTVEKIITTERESHTQVTMVRDSAHKRKYALKRMWCAHDDTVRMHAYAWEIEINQNMPSHPNVVRMIDAVTSSSSSMEQTPIGQRHFLVLLEWCAGGTLQERLHAKRTIAEGMQIVFSIANALMVLHSHQPAIAHRDCQPENILIHKDGTIKLGDFGSSTMRVYNPKLPTDRAAIETELVRLTMPPSYRAPELTDLQLGYPITCAVDVWSLGVIYYNILFGEQPFSGGKLAILSGHYPVPEKHPYTPSMMQLLQSMLTVNPSKRATIFDVVQNLSVIMKRPSVFIAPWSFGDKVFRYTSSPPPKIQTVSSTELSANSSNGIRDSKIASRARSSTRVSSTGCSFDRSLNNDAYDRRNGLTTSQLEHERGMLRNDTKRMPNVGANSFDVKFPITDDINIFTQHDKPELERANTDNISMSPQRAISADCTASAIISHELMGTQIQRLHSSNKSNLALAIPKPHSALRHRKLQDFSQGSHANNTDNVDADSGSIIRFLPKSGGINSCTNPLSTDGSEMSPVSATSPACHTIKIDSVDEIVSTSNSALVSTGNSTLQSKTSDNLLKVELSDSISHSPSLMTKDRVLAIRNRLQAARTRTATAHAHDYSMRRLSATRPSGSPFEAVSDEEHSDSDRDTMPAYNLRTISNAKSPSNVVMKRSLSAASFNACDDTESSRLTDLAELNVFEPPARPAHFVASTLEFSYKKSVSDVVSLLKPKVIRALIIASWTLLDGPTSNQRRASHDNSSLLTNDRLNPEAIREILKWRRKWMGLPFIYSWAESLPIKSSSIVAFKALLIAHLVISRGSPAVLTQAAEHRGFFDQMHREWVHGKEADAISDLIPLYAMYLSKRVSFGAHHLQVEGNFSLGFYLERLATASNMKITHSKWPFTPLIWRSMASLLLQLLPMCLTVLETAMCAQILRPLVDSHIIEIRESCIGPLAEDAVNMLACAIYILNLISIHKLTCVESDQFVQQLVELVPRLHSCLLRTLKFAGTFGAVSINEPLLPANWQVPVDAKYFPPASLVSRLSTQNSALCRNLLNYVVHSFAPAQTYTTVSSRDHNNFFNDTSIDDLHKTDSKSSVSGSVPVTPMSHSLASVEHPQTMELFSVDPSVYSTSSMIATVAHSPRNLSATSIPVDLADFLASRTQLSPSNSQHRRLSTSSVMHHLSPSFPVKEENLQAPSSPYSAYSNAQRNLSYQSPLQPPSPTTKVSPRANMAIQQSIVNDNGNSFGYSDTSHLEQLPDTQSSINLQCIAAQSSASAHVSPAFFSPPAKPSMLPTTQQPQQQSYEQLQQQLLQQQQQPQQQQQWYRQQQQQQQQRQAFTAAQFCQNNIPVPSSPSFPQNKVQEYNPFVSSSPLEDPIDKIPDEINFSELHLERKIGVGAYSEVYSGEWRGTEVAIKRLLLPNLGSSSEVIREFRSEVAMMRKLRHPRIVLFMAASASNVNELALVTELLNTSLFDLLHNTDVPLTYSTRLQIALDAAKGMAFLHLHQPPILHRDLKSPNCLLDSNNRCKVADFGLARSKGYAAMTGQCGTFQWMAPEVIGGNDYSEKADVFSFGIIMWELITRQPPYKGMNSTQVSVAVLTRHLRPEVPPWCPPDYRDLMVAAWNQDPVFRPSFSNIVDSLSNMLAPFIAAPNLHAGQCLLEQEYMLDPSLFAAKHSCIR